MPPAVALSLSLIFTLVILKIDSEGLRRSSKALWIPTLWMLIIASRMVGQWVANWGAAQSAEVMVDGSPLDRNIFLALILSAVIIVVNRRVGLVEVARHNRWVLLFLLFAGLSIAWSDFSLVSFKRYVKEIGNLAMVLVVLTEDSPVEAIQALVKRCAYALVPLSIALFKYYPELGRSYSRWTGDLSFTGVTNNKNSLGVLCAISAIGLAWSLLALLRDKPSSAWKNRAIVRGFMFVMSVGVLIASHSATSLVCCIIGITILGMMQLHRVRRNIASLALFVVLVGGGILVTGSLFPSMLSLLGRDSTLTGRTDIWKTVTGMATNSIVGDGYSSFWLGPRLDTMWALYSWRPIEAHNGYLEIYLDLGFTGVIMIAGIIVSAFLSAKKMLAANLEYATFCLTVIAVAVLYNITESAFRPGLLMYFFFMLAVIRFPRVAAPMDHHAEGQFDMASADAELLEIHEPIFSDH